jgi:hypothetical protein
MSYYTFPKNVDYGEMNKWVILHGVCLHYENGWFYIKNIDEEFVLLFRLKFGYENNLYS